jgi:ABC-type branched-subunit amino acid transport system ATPase component/ABC-type branched-subunit amino acid transport system permease subunit
VGAVIGAAVVGLVQGEVPALNQLPGISNLAESVGFSDLVLMVVTFVVMGLRGARLVGSRVRDEALAAVAPPGPARAAGPGARLGALIAVVLVVIFPFLPFVPFSIVGDAVFAAFYVIVALSLVLLTGWVGQISLAQAELVGVGAFVTAVMTNTFHISFPLNFVVAAASGGLIAAALGMVALRVRGLYLAVATLVFAAMADNFLFNSPWMGVEGGAASIQLSGVGDPHTIPYFDFNNIRLIYLLFVALAATCIYALANLRESRTGRAFFAVRGSEVAAASLGINVTRYKLLAFLMAGIMAGAAGNLYIVYLRTVVPDSFNILTSLFFVSVAVVGGLLSLGGAVAAGLLFAALHEVFFRIPQLAGLLNIVSAALLLAVLLSYPGGLAAAPAAATRALGRLFELLRLDPLLGSVRDAWTWAVEGFEKLEARRPSLSLRRTSGSAHGHDSVAMIDAIMREADEAADAAPAGNVVQIATASQPRWETFTPSARDLETSERASQVLLSANGIVVRFGGLTAVDDMSLEVRDSEIVGLIGPNGAGKTTMFNVISGLIQPTEGAVRLFGEDVSGMEVHRRAALGVGRTFQDIQLFPQLTVFDNLLVATHLRNISALPDHLLVTGRGLSAEAQARARVRRVLSFLGLAELGPRNIGDLSFGQLRMVEIARALVTGARLILLDEPASGLDNAESDRLSRLLLFVREQLEVSMLVIEHDIRTVAGLCDYLYVLDQGRPLKDGRPAAILRDESVVNAYLGKPAQVSA